MEGESEEPVIMSEIRISKLEMNVPEVWLKISVFVNSKGS
jgi:hypothetical protein